MNDRPEVTITPPVPGVAPPRVTDEQRIAVCETVLGGTDMGACICLLLPCGAALTMIAKRQPTESPPTPAEMVQMLTALYMQIGEAIKLHDCDASASEIKQRDVIFEVDEHGTSSELTREEFEARRRKAAH